jgi:hypothetical protein
MYLEIYVCECVYILWHFPRLCLLNMQLKWLFLELKVPLTFYIFILVSFNFFLFLKPM